MVSKPGELEKTGEFYEDLAIFCMPTYSDKVSCKYRKINELFDYFMWVEINIDEYLRGFDGKRYKVNYAEVKYAFENKALLWNPAPKSRTNREKKILKNFYRGQKQN